MSAAERLPDEPGVESREPEQAGVTILGGPWRAYRLSTILPFMGPAFVASVAYVDPGNFATNLSAGAGWGYSLLWVVVASNLVAMLMQYLSAKLGIATGRNLPEVIRDRCPRWATFGLWVAAEVAAMATDLAEFLGAALGFNILFGFALPVSALLTAVASVGILAAQRAGFRRLEIVIGSLVGVIAICYLVETLIVRPDWGQVARHSVTPILPGGSLLVAVGMLGATVMPHVIYLHSALTQDRVPARGDRQRRRLLHFNALDVVIGMTLAGLVNMAMLYMAAATFHAHGLTSVSDLRSAYHTLTPLLGHTAAVVFGLALLASGLASSAVGTMAGQVIMGGFLKRTVPIWVRRLVTMVPAIVVISLNVPSTQIIVISQAVLSLVLPCAVVPLVWFTSRRAVMGPMVNSLRTIGAAIVCAALIVCLNLLLLSQVVGLPG